MAAQPTTDRGRRTRQRIVDAATDVVAEKGAVGASLDEVGARASASRSQLYHYFDDRDDLMRAVVAATADSEDFAPDSPGRDMTPIRRNAAAHTASPFLAVVP